MVCSALDLPLTAAEAGAGLVPPAAATYLLGDGGSILIILVSALASQSVAPDTAACTGCVSCTVPDTMIMSLLFPI